jgi:hypothetical protein
VLFFYSTPLIRTARFSLQKMIWEVDECNAYLLMVTLKMYMDDPNKSAFNKLDHIPTLYHISFLRTLISENVCVTLCAVYLDESMVQ